MWNYTQTVNSYKVINADSAFIILLILLASQNSQFFQWSSDDGRFQNILGFMGPHIARMPIYIGEK